MTCSKVTPPTPIPTFRLAVKAASLDTLYLTVTLGGGGGGPPARPPQKNGESAPGGAAG